MIGKLNDREYLERGIFTTGTLTMGLSKTGSFNNKGSLKQGISKILNP